LKFSNLLCIFTLSPIVTPYPYYLLYPLFTVLGVQKEKHYQPDKFR